MSCRLLLLLLLLLLTTAVDGCRSAGFGGWSRMVDKVLVNKFITTSARTCIGDGVGDGDECDECDEPVWK